MPYEIKRVGTYYSVVNKDTGKKHSEHSTHANALAQLRLLEGIEHGTIKNPGMGRVRKYKAIGMIGSSMDDGTTG